MKTRVFFPMILVLTTITSLLVSGCSPTLVAEVSVSENKSFDGQDQLGVKSSSPFGAINVKVDQSVPEGMQVFEGDIFVASTKPKAGRWKSAGWRIAKQPHSTDSEEVPVDCTLYPHKGVEDQWIGSCSGYIFIPIDGAKHIAVVLTLPDGNTSLIQVAPSPDR